MIYAFSCFTIHDTKRAILVEEPGKASSTKVGHELHACIARGLAKDPNVRPSADTLERCHVGLEGAIREVDVRPGGKVKVSPSTKLEARCLG
jgi:hypothetical protein